MSQAVQALDRPRPVVPPAVRARVTDVYSHEQRMLLVRYPPLLVVALGLGGLLAFALTGLLGYGDEAPMVVAMFHQPWPLFLWLSALLLTLEASIFRHPALRLRLFSVLSVTVISMAVLSAIYFYRHEVQTLLQQIADQPHPSLAPGWTLDDVLGSPGTYTLLNALILAVFWGDALLRWVRRARGLAPNPGQYAPWRSWPGEGRELPRMEDLLSGDLIAGAGLMLVLALALQPPVIGWLAQLAQSHATISGCTLSLPQTCAQTTTLTFLDLVGGLVALSLGLLSLAFSATLSGLGAVGAVDESEVEDPRLLLRDESSTESVSEQVSLTLVNTMRSALDRRARLALANLVFSLRTVVWPVLIFAATVALALVARSLQAYLHSDKSLETIALYLLPALGWGVAALVAALAGIGVLTFSRRVVANTLRFLSLSGFVVLLTFWIFSLALWGINQWLVLAALTSHTPFAQLGASTLLSALALAGYGILAVRAARE